MWNRRLKLGTYFEIDVFLHWSFGLLVAYVVWASYQDGLMGTLFSLCLLVGMFFCVTLHEYGHALVARRFGIETIDITLLPIGGVARLVRIPRVPLQELLVAIAGPAVNIVIVACLLGLLIALPGLGFPSITELASEPEAMAFVFESINTPSLLGFLLSLVLINTALVLFNFLPAFPMDGGRVLRSILAMCLEYRKATRIASIVGLCCAGLMVCASIYSNAPTAGLVAIFICYAGLAEARQVNFLEPIRKMTVGHVMDYQPPFLTVEQPLHELAERIPLMPIRAIPVVDVQGYVVGIVTLASASEAINQGTLQPLSIGDVTDFGVPMLSPNQSLEIVLTQPNDGRRQFPVADEDGRLVGMLDLDTLQSRIHIARRS
ncbi:MAG: site-2 protease family protein [Planctomycetota bacterium]